MACIGCDVSIPGDVASGSSSGVEETSVAASTDDTTAGLTSTGGTSTSSSTTAASVGESTSGSESTDTTGSEVGSSSGGEEAALLCPEDGEFGLSIAGVNQDEHEGRTVWVSAVEPDPMTSQEDHGVAVLLEDLVTDGAFDLSCPQGLTTNPYYPSIAVVIDTDGNGVCSDADLAARIGLFAWTSEQRYLFDGPQLLSGETETPWVVDESAWQPVADMQGLVPFCDYYFGGLQR